MDVAGWLRDLGLGQYARPSAKSAACQTRLSRAMPSMSAKGGKADVWEWDNEL